MKRTFITKDAIVEVTTLDNVDILQMPPHEIIKEFVAEYTKSNEFDKCFDKAFEIGLSNGTEAYDTAINIILEMLNIPEALVFARLREKGINIQVS